MLDSSSWQFLMHAVTSLYFFSSDDDDDEKNVWNHV